MYINFMNCFELFSNNFYDPLSLLSFILQYLSISYPALFSYQFQHQQSSISSPIIQYSFLIYHNIYINMIHNLELTYKEYQHNGSQINNSKLDKYIIYEKINHENGVFGKVYRAMNLETKKIVAVKLMDKVAIEKDYVSEGVKIIRRRLMRTQSELMMEISSPHIMKLYDVYENEQLKIMVIEYCNEGTLSEYIYNKKIRISEREAIQILKHLIRGIAAMHEKSIIHRDLKSENIMRHNGVFKIIDLGFAKKLPNNYEAFNGTRLGTRITMAPEVMKKDKYGVKADIWSLGIIFYEMIYGHLPYEPLKSEDMYEQIMNKDIFDNKLTQEISPNIIKLMKRMLKKDQTKRISWLELISHPIFKQKELSDEVSMIVDVDHLNDYSTKLQENEGEDIHEKLPLKDRSKQMKKSVKLEKISMKERNQLLKQLDESQRMIINEAKKYYLQCLKTQFILNEIIIPIEQTKIFVTSQRKMTEFLYLLSSRCFCNMSYTQFNLLKDNIECVQILIKSIKILYDSVKDKFEFYSQKLQKIENKKLEIVSDRFRKLLKGKQLKRKDSFLVGVESEHADYTKEQQIQFTYQQYILPLATNRENKPQLLINKLLKYKKINFITEKDLKQKKFSLLVRQILINEL